MLKLWDRGTQQILPMTHNVSTNSYELFLRDGIFHDTSNKLRLAYSCKWVFSFC